MPSIYSRTHFQERLSAAVYSGTSLIISGEEAGEVLHIAGLPAAVAKRTADAFNAAWSEIEDAADLAHIERVMAEPAE